MHVEITSDGGFVVAPGLAKPLVLDSATLPLEQRAQLQRLVDAALSEKVQRSSAKTRSAKTRSFPDGRHYRVTIQTEDARNEIEADDPIRPPAVDALMQFVRVNGGRQ